MPHVLIIDDEEPVRQGIKLLGKWEELGIDTISEAGDGQTGLRILQEEQPEIVLLDMKMPIINGAEFLQITRKEHPDVKFVIISGYDDFEYTKQAIRSKVLDYLLKPVKEAELNQVLANAVKELTAEKEARVLSRLIAGNLAVSKLNKQLLAAMISENDKLSLWEAFQNMDPKSMALFQVAVLRIMNGTAVIQQKFQGDPSAAYASFIDTINASSNEWYRSFTFKNPATFNELIIILAMPHSSEQDNIHAIAGLNGIVAALEDLFGVYAIVGVGEAYPDFESVNHTYDQAVSILDSVNMFQDKGNVFTACKNVPEGSVRSSLIDKRDLLFHAFESGSVEYSKNIIAEYFNIIRQIGYFSLEDARKTMLEFMIIIDDISHQFGLESRTKNQYFKHGQLTGTITGFDDLTRIINLVLEETFDGIKKGMRVAGKENIYKIKEYIDGNYFKEISLNQFSERFYVSKEYLSRIFKEQFGIGIYEYVLKVRMEHARIMLADPEMKVQTVAENVGYNDQHYFSKAFKKYYGVSPSEFRQNTLD